MSESEGPGGHTCPECGAPRGPGGSPSCDCTERAAEALRETRRAEAAAAEDFDPLRIRPYVEGVAVAESQETGPRTGAVPSVEATLPLRPVPGPGTTVLRMLGDEETDEPGARAPGAGPSRRRSRRTVLLSAAGAGVGVAVLAAAGFASGLFSYDTPSRADGATQEVRASVPEPSTSAPASPTAPASSAVSRSLVRPHSARPSPSPSATPSASPTPTAPSPGASGPSSATPSAAPPSATARTAPAAEPVLRRGDTGPQVTELQQRLRQLNLYDDQIDGVFTRPVEDAVRNYQTARGITGDTYGEYGPATRKSLEAETSQP